MRVLSPFHAIEIVAVEFYCSSFLILLFSMLSVSPRDEADCPGVLHKTVVPNKAAIATSHQCSPRCTCESLTNWCMFINIWLFLFYQSVIYVYYPFEFTVLFFYVWMEKIIDFSVLWNLFISNIHSQNSNSSQLVILFFFFFFAGVIKSNKVHWTVENLLPMEMALYSWYIL